MKTKKMVKPRKYWVKVIDGYTETYIPSGYQMNQCKINGDVYIEFISVKNDGISYKFKWNKDLIFESGNL